MDTAKSFSFFVITVRDNNNHYFKVEITRGSENITAIEAFNIVLKFGFKTLCYYKNIRYLSLTI